MKKKISKKQKNINEHLGELIREHRQECDLTIVEMSRRVRVSYQQYLKYETGESGIGLARLIDIAKVLKISAYDLLEPVIGEKVTDTPQQKRIGHMLRKKSPAYLRHLAAILNGVK